MNFEFGGISDCKWKETGRTVAHSTSIRAEPKKGIEDGAWFTNTFNSTYAYPHTLHIPIPSTYTHPGVWGNGTKIQ